MLLHRSDGKQTFHSCRFLSFKPTVAPLALPPDLTSLDSGMATRKYSNASFTPQMLPHISTCRGSVTGPESQPEGAPAVESKQQRVVTAPDNRL